MIAVDTNLLVYSHHAESVNHETTIEVLRPLFERNKPCAVPWPCIHEFVGVVTKKKIFSTPSTLSEAFRFVESLMGAPCMQFLSESPGYYEKLRTLVTSSKVTGPRIHDARIAALCLHHGVRELWTADRDFLSFPQLKVRNPLVTP